MHNDLLNCRPNDDRYAFLRPGQIQLTNLRAAGRIKDISKKIKSVAKIRNRESPTEHEKHKDISKILLHICRANNFLTTNNNLK